MNLSRTTFDRLVAERGGIEQLREDLAARVAARLQLQAVEVAEPGGHPDRAILDRISDSMAREVYRVCIEHEERGGAGADEDEDWEDFDD